MKLKGYVFDESGKPIKIADNLSSEQYQNIWNALQSKTMKGIRGYLILKKEEKK